MESRSTPARVARLDAALLRLAAKHAAAAASDAASPGEAIDAAVGAFHDEVAGILPSVFVLDHGRLWLVAQRGYAVVPDGMKIQSGVMGRAVRLGRAQLAPNVCSDSDYISALPGVGSELAVPLRAGGIVGVLNIESERAFPDGPARLVRPLASALGPLVEAFRTGRSLDLPALARLFVHLGSIRDPDEIAALAAASLARILPLESTQVLLWDELGSHAELASWRSESLHCEPLSEAELESARALVDPTVVCQLLDTGRRQGRPRPGGSLVWLPLRANNEELGALIGMVGLTARVDPAQLDTAAVLAAHVAVSLDAAIALRRERESAVTDQLTGILNRRGLEERIERELGSAHERRAPLTLLVIDCDDFKDINDRAGHEFGDALLREVADLLARSLPEGAVVGRLGGDEFVVMLPGAGADTAVALGGRIRSVLAEGLTDAGYPLRVSAGISTYPFDGAGPTALLRAADQALYAAKNAGKDRIASFRDVVRPDQQGASGGAQSEQGPRRGSRGDGSVLAAAMAAMPAIVAEDTVAGVCNRLCKALVFVVGATGCSASRVVGDYLVDATEHALREISLGDEAAYRISDFPLSAEVLRSGQPRAVSFLDDDVDPAEAFILRDLGMNALLMLPLHVSGRPWGLVELYEMRLRRFTEDDVAIAQFLAAQAERRLAAVGSTDAPRHRPPVYELPPDGELPGPPRTR
jgi:diguanylate cyclase (GGDEF)-like protein